MNPIADIRARLGLTQTALADALGVGQSAISQYESGHVRPSPAVAGRLISCARERGVCITYDDVYGTAPKAAQETANA